MNSFRICRQRQKDTVIEGVVFNSGVCVTSWLVYPSEGCVNMWSSFDAFIDQAFGDMELDDIYEIEFANRQKMIINQEDTMENEKSPNNEEMSVSLTEAAAKEILNIIKEQELDAAKTYLRIGVKGGGCSGFEYVLDLTENLKPDDLSFDQHGVMVICDEKSLLYLNGTKVDFKDELMQRGFVFNNPNATNTCGCNKSFNTD